MVRADGTAGASFLYAPFLEDCALIIITNFGGARVSAIGGDVSLALRASIVCSALGGATGLFRRA